MRTCRDDDDALARGDGRRTGGHLFFEGLLGVGQHSVQSGVINGRRGFRGRAGHAGAFGTSTCSEGESQYRDCEQPKQVAGGGS